MCEKKGFFGKIFDSLDKKMKAKAQEGSCCCFADNNKEKCCPEEEKGEKKEQGCC